MRSVGPVLALLTALAQAACTESPRAPQPGAKAEARSDRPRLLALSAWPGRGLQLSAAVPGELDPSLLRLARQDGSTVPIRVEPAVAGSGITGFVIAPDADEATHAARLESVRTAIAALPAAERVAVWLGSGTLPLLSELTDRHEHVLERLAHDVAPAEPEPLEPGTLDNVAQRLMRVSSAGAALERTLVFVGLEPPSASDLPELTSKRTALDLARLPEPSADRAQSATRVRIGSCGEFEAFEPLILEYGSARIELAAPDTAPELAAMGCDAEAAARDEYPAGDVVQLELTEAELAQHDQYARDKDEADFTLSVRIGDAAAVPARAHFRGQTSLDCGRKSYSIHFQDDAARRLGKYAYGSEFFLISLCKEAGAFHQVLANRVMSRLGLFPLEQRYVQLRVADRERGIYLLLEKPDEHLKRNQLALAAVVRRRFDANGQPAELKYPKADRDPELAAAMMAAYDASVGRSALDAEGIRQRFDVDSYLRWLALQSFFQCGDYIDETFVYGSEELGRVYFHNLGWDTDDLYEACHHGGKYAYPDPAGLTFCAEAVLDHTLLSAADVYRQYALTLRDLLRSELDPDRVAGELRSVHDELFGHLVDDAVCTGTGESIDGQPATCERFRPWIEARMAQLETDMRARAELLRARLADYGVEP